MTWDDPVAIFEATWQMVVDAYSGRPGGSDELRLRNTGVHRARALRSVVPHIDLHDAELLEERSAVWRLECTTNPLRPFWDADRVIFTRL
jgi:hypothetical protein